MLLQKQQIHKEKKINQARMIDSMGSIILFFEDILLTWWSLVVLLKNNR